VLIASLPSGERTMPSPAVVGASCPVCTAPVIAKCGRIVSWHFAHKVDSECDPWADPETEWHRKWKARWPVDQQEVVIGDHRADVLTPGRKVIEFQHSSIDPDEVADREQFYAASASGLAWVLDMTEAFEKNRLILGDAGPSGFTTFHFTPQRPRLGFFGRVGSVEVFYHLGGRRLLWTAKHTVHGKPPWAGWVVDASEVFAWDGVSVDERRRASEPFFSAGIS